MTDTPETLLVVDDNAMNLRLVSFLLKSRGYRVLTATNADEALAVLRETVPPVILMDLQLPGMDGLTLTRQLKADPRTRRAFIVAFTAYAMKGDDAKAFEAGCDAYLTKPVDTRALPEQIAGFFARARPEEASR